MRKLSRELSDMTLLHHQLTEDNELLREQLQESHSIQAQLSNEVCDHMIPCDCSIRVFNVSR